MVFVLLGRLRTPGRLAADSLATCAGAAIAVVVLTVGSRLGLSPARHVQGGDAVLDEGERGSRRRLMDEIAALTEQALERSR
ncbi:MULTISPECIES: hypothetical protein [unclassified Streptomyces]|uniref:hypothetical protein n=1 Tax=unclassified Streptomyces TaxID=2593676 RepID=UPI000382EF15|nr:hypothetical protein [Streptomyces sp. 303MFCol5.2]